MRLSPLTVRHMVPSVGFWPTTIPTHLGSTDIGTESRRIRLSARFGLMAAFTNERVSPRRTAAERKARENILLIEGGKVKADCSKNKYCNEADYRI
jgi:hypothetical protein